MGKAKIKIEARSKTGHPHYRRAGLTFTSAWSEIDESELTEDQKKVLREDPYLEFRVGGKRVLGASQEGDETDSEMDLKVANLTSAVEDLTKRNDALSQQVVSLAAAKTELEGSLAKASLEKQALTDKVASLEAAAAKAAKAAAKAPSADTAPAGDAAK